ncbi:MAG: VTT domain-containing protein [Desulfurococcaceae archaeon]|nr:VTT domain-containing protein [Desulfurococcaceae archaeon]
MIKELLDSSFVKLFGLAFISNSIPYMTVPYLIIIAPFLARMRGLELVSSIFALALGATLGKLVVYGISRSLRRVHRVKLKLSGLTQALNTYRKATFTAIFLAAALPVPDDVVYIPAGISGYSAIYFFTALLLGKLVITALTAVYGAAVVYVIEESGVQDWVYVLAMSALTLLAIYIINKINWSEVNRLHEEKGVKSAIIYTVYSAKDVLLSTILQLISWLKKRIKY